MKNISLAESYIRRAERRLKDARRALEEDFIPDVVRYCQESVEILVKGIFRLAGMEYAKVHDLSVQLKVHANLFPDWFAKHIAWIADLTCELAKSRGISFYGDEAREIPPERLFNRNYARKVLTKASKLFGLAKKLLDEWRTGPQKRR